MSLADQHQLNPTFKKPSCSAFPHIALILTQVVGLISPRGTLRKDVYFAVTLGVFMITIYHPHFTNDLGLAQPFSIFWPSLLSTLEKICLTGDQGPEVQFWRVDKRPSEATLFQSFGFSKIKWALTLLINLRGIRWNFQVKNVPQRSPIRSRSFFCLKQTLWAVYYFLLADLTSQLSIRFLYTLPDDKLVSSTERSMTLYHTKWYWSIAKCYVFGATPYFMMNMQYTLASVWCVLLHISKPEV